MVVKRRKGGKGGVGLADKISARGQLYNAVTDRGGKRN